MKKNIFRRGMSGLLAVLMTFTALMSIYRRRDHALRKLKSILGNA